MNCHLVQHQVKESAGMCRQQAHCSSWQEGKVISERREGGPRKPALMNKTFVARFFINQKGSDCRTLPAKAPVIVCKSEASEEVV